MGRFILFVGMAFVTAFVGVSWAARGFPMDFSSSAVVTVVPLQRTVDRHFGDGGDKEARRKDWEAEHTAQSDKNPKLDALRLDALQAATAYQMSPCDRTMKANLIDALTAYTRAWQAKLDCPRPLGMVMFCDQKLKDVSETFSTPLDRRVQAALHEAFEQKGIVKADFPEDVRQDVLPFAGPSFWSNDSPICLPRQRGSANPAP
jgi:hypothetical protein